jgi:hypothetical protein
MEVANVERLFHLLKFHDHTLVTDCATLDDDIELIQFKPACPIDGLYFDFLDTLTYSILSLVMFFGSSVG